MKNNTVLGRVKPRDEDAGLKGFFFIIIMLICCLYIHRIDIYIPAFRLSIWSEWVMYGFGIFLALWCCYSPCEKACRGGFLLELMFYLFPFELLLLLVFAQYHPVISILLLACLIGGTAAFRIQLYREAGDRARSPKLRARHRFAASRLFVVLAAVLLIVPSLVSVFGYSLETPSYTPSQAAMEEISALTQENAEAQDPATAFLNVFRADAWEACGPEARITALQTLHDYEAEKLGMPAVPLSAARISPDTLGYYSPGENEILVDLERLQSADPMDAIDTTLHETYHAFEFFLIGQIDWDAAYTKNAYFDEARSWYENGQNYVNAETDFDAYYEQPLEASAREFAFWESLDLLHLLNGEES